jgi:hypothetical protein
MTLPKVECEAYIDLSFFSVFSCNFVVPVRQALFTGYQDWNHEDTLKQHEKNSSPIQSFYYLEAKLKII